MKAADQVAAFERLPLGEVWAERAAAAAAAIDTERAAAAAVLFPVDLLPTTPAAVAEYQWLTGRIGAAGYGDRLAELHRRALVGNPELGALLRSVEAIEDVEAAAAARATPAHTRETHAAAGCRAADVARRQYETSIARQLLAVPGELAPAAAELLAVDVLAERLAVAKLRHEVDAAEALARLETERREAERAVVDRSNALVREAAAAAAAAESEAQAKRDALRRARGEALAELLKARLARAKRPDRLMLRTPNTYNHVATLAANAPRLSAEQLAQYERAAVNGTYTEDGPDDDSWRRA